MDLTSCGHGLGMARTWLFAAALPQRVCVAVFQESLTKIQAKVTQLTSEAQGGHSVRKRRKETERVYKAEEGSPSCHCHYIHPYP